MHRMKWSRRIYCAGSIAGGREDRDSYEILHRLLQSWGEVLPRAVASEEVSQSGEGVAARTIFEKESQLIKNCDYFILEASTPSLGVGFQTAQALHAEKPILALYRPESPLSAILVGAPIKYEAYRSVGEMETILEYFFETEWA